MDKHIFTCDNDRCKLSEGFVYIYVDTEAEWSFVSKYPYNLPNMICPACQKSLRFIETINEQGDCVEHA